jgi:hypothetical protein
MKNHLHGCQFSSDDKFQGAVSECFQEQENNFNFSGISSLMLLYPDSLRLEF